MKNETKWSIDQAHSEIAFKVRHLMIANLRGNFKKFDASIYTVGDNFSTVEIDVWIDPASIFTGDDTRDEHLKGPDFFDVKKHKQINFTSGTLGKPDADGNHELWGELTMKNITKNIMLLVSYGGAVLDPWGKEKVGFTVTGTINRGDWDLNWNTKINSGGLLVSDEVHIICEIELTKSGKKEETIVLEDKATLDGVMSPSSFNEARKM